MIVLWLQQMQVPLQQGQLLMHCGNCQLLVGCQWMTTEASFSFKDCWHKHHQNALQFALLILLRGCTAWGGSSEDYSKNEEVDDFGGNSSKTRRSLEGFKTLQVWLSIMQYIVYMSVQRNLDIQRKISCKEVWPVTLEDLHQMCRDHVRGFACDMEGQG